jgi:hypothetical protein
MAPTTIVGTVDKLTVQRPKKPGLPPEVKIVIDIAGFDGRDLNGLIGLLSQISIQPVQQVMEGVRT